MSTINEQIVTGRAHRVLIDKVAKLWQRISFWTKASDVEFNDGNTAETKVGAIKGITTDLNTTETGYAADMTALTQLYSEIIGVLNSWKASLHITQTVLNSDGSIAYYYTDTGGDTPFKWNPRTDADSPDNLRQLLLHNWTGNGSMSYGSGYVISSMLFNSSVTSLYNYSPYVKIPYNAYLSVTCESKVTKGNWGYSVTFQVIKSNGTLLYSSTQNMYTLSNNIYTFTTGNLAVNEGDSIQIKCIGSVNKVGYETGGTMTVRSLTITER